MGKMVVHSNLETSKWFKFGRFNTKKAPTGLFYRVKTVHIGYVNH